jgi:hypothetical protein
MAKISYKGNGNMGVTFENYFKGVSQKVVQREDQILIALNERILELTPVWEGDSIVNWRWSTKAPIFEHIQPLGQNIKPGPTNTMPLGSEPRRAINEARPRKSLMSALRATAPEDIYLTNSSDSIVDLEYGLLPTPERSRSPRGIVRLAIKEVMGSLR